jgi:hypothetical protein
MISGVRDHALALACIRHGLPADHGRGMDRLPAGVTGPLGESLVRQLDAAELSRAFRIALHGLLGEIRSADEKLARRLHETMVNLAEDC